MQTPTPFLTRIFVCAALILGGAGPQASAAAGNEPAMTVAPSGLALPRFVSLGAREVNMRAGPGAQYPIKWLYRRPGYPVMVEAEFDIWRKVRDREGEVGWIHGSLLSGRRMVVITAPTRQPVRTLYEAPHPASVPVMRAEDGVQGELRKCRGGWCEIRIDGKKGWLPAEQLWGILETDKAG